MFTCIRCKTIYDKYQQVCDNCAGIHTIVNTPVQSFYSTSSRKKFNSAKDLIGIHHDYRTIPGFEFLSNLATKVAFLLYGIQGSGKSIFALRFANVLSKLSKNDKVLFLAVEEGSKSSTIQKKLLDEKIDSDNLKIEDVGSYKDIPNVFFQSGAKHLFIDSVTDLNLSNKEMKTLSNLRKIVRGFFLFIVHCTKDENYKGDSSFGHFVDVKLRADEGKLFVEKNRFGMSHVAYTIFDIDKQQEENDSNSKVEIYGPNVISNVYFRQS